MTHIHSIFSAARLTQQTQNSYAYSSVCSTASERHQWQLPPLGSMRGMGMSTRYYNKLMTGPMKLNCHSFGGLNSFLKKALLVHRVIILLPCHKGSLPRQVRHTSTPVPHRTVLECNCAEYRRSSPSGQWPTLSRRPLCCPSQYSKLLTLTNSHIHRSACWKGAHSQLFRLK